MRITHLAVENFKGLRDVRLPMSRFVCIIGQNNSGKSSLLQSLLLFVDGRKLAPSYYYDPGQDITVAVRLEEITDDDLNLLAPEHRTKIEQVLSNRSITLVRRYSPDGSSRLRRLALLPKDRRFSAEAVEALTKGKKPGKAFADEVVNAFPELQGKLDTKSTQTQVKELIGQLADSLPEEEKVQQETDLPSGIDNSVRALLPEPIYIPAVKDLADDIKTKDSTSFGKLLGVLLSAIAPQLENAAEAFRVLNQSLNPIEQPDGTVIDNRLDAVKLVEATIQKFVRENFASVGISIRVPPPEIKTVLSNAEIWAHDGVPGEIASKGDGLKRAVTFSILRSYVELRRHPALVDSPQGSGGYLFLFEEPELYLHPTAQKALFDALTELAKPNHVVVSTHSPLFFGPEQTGTFVKMVKRQAATVGAKPFGHALPVDLGELDNKTRFQLISYETNNTAFFGSAVLLVEGDTDYLIVPHLARVLNPDWSFERAGVAVCRVAGKGGIRRYREFFEAFDVRVAVLADLDCVVEGFEQLELSDGCSKKRVELLARVDHVIEETGAQAPWDSEDLRRAAHSPTRKQLWTELCEVQARSEKGEATSEELRRAGQAFFAPDFARTRTAVLEESQDPEVVGLKRELLALLRDEDVYLLERGNIERYFPADVSGKDKPSRALDFVSKVTSREQALRLCSEVKRPDSGTGAEFDLIFSGIFKQVDLCSA